MFCFFLSRPVNAEKFPEALTVPSSGLSCASFLPGLLVTAMVFVAAISLPPWPCLALVLAAGPLAAGSG